VIDGLACVIDGLIYHNQHSSPLLPLQDKQGLQ